MLDEMPTEMLKGELNRALARRKKVVDYIDQVIIELERRNEDVSRLLKENVG